MIRISSAEVLPIDERLVAERVHLNERQAAAAELLRKVDPSPELSPAALARVGRKLGEYPRRPRSRIQLVPALAAGALVLVTLNAAALVGVRVVRGLSTAAPSKEASSPEIFKPTRPRTARAPQEAPEGSAPVADRAEPVVALPSPQVAPPAVQAPFVPAPVVAERPERRSVRSSRPRLEAVTAAPGLLDRDAPVPTAGPVSSSGLVATPEVPPLQAVPSGSRGGAPISQTQATPTASPAPSPAPPDPMSLEIIELRRGLEQKKQGDLAGAIVTLEHYRQTNRQGTFLFEASLAEAQAELELGRRKEAAQTLDALGDDPRSPRAEELGILRAELWSQTGRCKDALPVFARSQETPGLAERALYGHARCLETLGDFTTSREEFKRYLDRFPSGVFSAEVVRALGL